jgi:outer membrane lipoprotein-sorting protein
MKRIIQTTLLAFLALFAYQTRATAQDATEIMKKSHLAYYYAGTDGIAEVHMTLIDKNGGQRVREFTMLRLDKEDGGDQKYYTYFKKPSDVSRLTFMVYKTGKGSDQRWIYVPSIDLVKPISADDKNSSFVGSDFSYEDVSGRHWTEDAHTLMPESQVDGKAVYVIQSVPVKPYKGFAKKVSYIDKETFLPLKEEYFDAKDELTRRLHADKIEVISGFPTVTTRSMESVKKGSKTIVEFSHITYNAGLKDEIFTERYLKNPPHEFIK